MGKNESRVPDWAAKNQLVKLMYKTFRMLKNEGLSQTLFAARYVTGRYYKLKELKKEFYLSKETREFQQNFEFKYAPKISIIIPLYNTPEKFLRELFQSIVDQSYSNFEVCLADGSTDEGQHVEEICNEFKEQDERFIYRKLIENKGIAGNTNEAIKLATGEYIALVDHDDLIAQSALFEVVKAINEQNADFIYTDEATFINRPSDSRSMHLKPCYSPDYLRSCNYICHLSVIKKSLAEDVGLYDPEFDGSQDYDFTLRVTENAKKIHHIPKPLYYWRIHAGSVADDISAKPYAYTAAKKAVEAHLERVRLHGEVLFSKAVPMLHVKYEIKRTPLVSIVIPTSDHIDVLKTCIDSIFKLTTYQNFEIIVVENNSKKQETFEYYKALMELPSVKIVFWEKEFNFSAINNFGVQHAAGDHILFLNNDIEVITPEWIEEMLMFTIRKDVGACGIKLLYPDNMVQHGGIAMGVCGSAANLCPLFPREHEGYMSRLAVVSNMSACTAACLMVKKKAFLEVGGFEESLSVAFNDVDLCLKIREKGYLVVFNPVAECYHHESRSRGYDNKGEKKQRMENEKAILKARWEKYYTEEGDPYYNRNFGKNSISYDA